jgi:hypothetical protein
MASNNHGLGARTGVSFPKNTKIISPFRKGRVLRKTRYVSQPQQQPRHNGSHNSPGRAARRFLEVAIGKIATNPQQPRHTGEKELGIGGFIKDTVSFGAGGRENRSGQYELIAESAVSRRRVLPARYG